MKLLIGLVGASGAGKGTVAKLLQELIEQHGSTVEQLTFSGPLRHTLDYYNLPATRHRLQLLARQLEELGGQGTLSRKVVELAEQSSAEVVMLDGVRWIYDYEVIRRAKPNVLIYVTTEAKIRFERMKSRGQKDGEHQLPWKQFMEEESAANERDIATIGSKADVEIDNNNGIEVLKEQVERIFVEQIRALI